MTTTTAKTLEALRKARDHVSLLGAQEHMDTVNAALDAVPRALQLLQECERTLEMWADVAPAVSLRADIRRLLGAALAEAAQAAPESAQAPFGHFWKATYRGTGHPLSEGFSLAPVQPPESDRGCDVAVTPLYTHPAPERVAVALTRVQLNNIAHDAQIAFCLDKFKSFETAFAHGVQRASWAANGLTAPTKEST